VVASVGTLLIAFGLGQHGSAGIAAGLYYLPHGTFAAALLFLLAEALRRRRPASADSFAADADMPRHALWGGLFFVAAVATAGLPPLSGFVGKFLILNAATGYPWVWAVILVSALAGLIALSRAGTRLFFSARSADSAAPPLPVYEPHSAARELVAIGGLLGLIFALTLGAGPAVEFTQATAAQLADPAAYIAAVLGSAR